LLELEVLLARIERARRQVVLRIAYCGPAGAGKTASYELVHNGTARRAGLRPTEHATESGSYSSFEYHALGPGLGPVGGLNALVRILTAPGPTDTGPVWREVLEGVDGVVFVADSDPARAAANLAALDAMEETLRDLGIDPRSVPTALQLTERDEPAARAVADLETELGRHGPSSFVSVVSGSARGLVALRRVVAEMLANLELG
jgi:hypothetical protein